ncbi:hypothetical protein PMZ80_008588 [Knufia obscura]|uniref:F-box domain-containing protein n=2 Tax=Knufia TaxID=430999 RepID=A0AAN8EI47_9EURO|nr:hypothetical protein PMZ80_008588 [Knufia obscura]KAK5952043.1 hypothetical protein OHC33_006930 [Knufia fluminis]
MPRITDLSTEILQLIFQHLYEYCTHLLEKDEDLTERDLNFTNVINVCKGWRNIVIDTPFFDEKGREQAFDLHKGYFVNCLEGKSKLANTRYKPKGYIRYAPSAIVISDDEDEGNTDDDCIWISD